MKPLNTEEKKNLAYGIINAICPTHDCAKCPIDAIWKRYNSNSVSTPGCAKALLKAFCDGEPVAVSKTETTTPPTCSKTEQALAKPALPKWCKVGQWVRIYGRINRRYLGEITKTIHGSRMVEVTVLENGKTEKHSCDPTDLRPIRFRLPTLEEAYEYLGKVMAFKGGLRELVCIVDVDDVTSPDGEIVEEAMLFINRHPAETLMCSTIDGVPFGVPEVDTEAEKEAQE